MHITFFTGEIFYEKNIAPKERERQGLNADLERLKNEEFDPAIHQTEDEYDNEKKEKVEKIVNDLNEIQEELDHLVETFYSFHHYNFHTTPNLLRPNCPDFLNIRGHNNNYDINFGYITSCLHTTEWNNIYIDAIGKDEVRQQE